MEHSEISNAARPAARSLVRYSHRFPDPEPGPCIRSIKADDEGMHEGRARFTGETR